jgi:hypothetical protein
MVRWGNKRANEYWEANVPQDYYIPDENDGVGIVERWIRDKYEKAKFKGKGTPRWADEDVDLAQPLASLLAGRIGKDKTKRSGSSKAPVQDLKLKAPTAPVAAAAKPPPVSDPFDLLGFDAFPVAAMTTAALLQPAKHAGSDLLSVFGGMSMQAAPAATTSSADIMSMFSAPAPAPMAQAAQQGFNPFAGSAPGQAQMPYGGVNQPSYMQSQMSAYGGGAMPMAGGMPTGMAAGMNAFVAAGGMGGGNQQAYATQPHSNSAAVGTQAAPSGQVGPNAFDAFGF